MKAKLLVIALTAGIVFAPTPSQADWDPGDMRALALSLRGVRSDDVTFLTAPVAGTELDPTYGDVVVLDQAKCAELFDALRNDRMDAYLRKYPDDRLADERQIG